MIRKLKRIALSRFRKDKDQKWIEARRDICKKCPHNSKNTTKKPKLIVRVLIFLSDLYSRITGKSETDDIGNCTLCGCSLYYKTAEKWEICEDNRW